MLYHNLYCIFSCYHPSTKPGLRCYITVVTVTWVDDRVEAGSNTSTVAPRVIGGSKKKGSLESETVKYGCESHGTQTRE
jgi:hypothetical protein